jgi:hypothetical protein
MPEGQGRAECGCGEWVLWVRVPAAAFFFPPPSVGMIHREVLEPGGEGGRENLRLGGA